MHRDLKSANILFRLRSIDLVSASEARDILTVMPDFRIKFLVSDFGFSKPCDFQRAKSVKGAPIYTVLEIVDGNYSKTVAIYALGVVYYSVADRGGLSDSLIMAQLHPNPASRSIRHVVRVNHEQTIAQGLIAELPSTSLETLDVFPYLDHTSTLPLSSEQKVPDQPITIRKPVSGIVRISDNAGGTPKGCFQGPSKTNMISNRKLPQLPPATKPLSSSSATQDDSHVEEEQQQKQGSALPKIARAANGPQTSPGPAPLPLVSRNNLGPRRRSVRKRHTRGNRDVLTAIHEDDLHIRWDGLTYATTY
ncbi:Hypothetical protein D9617_46g064450 [Elsinoe fawcettii]|nr:Hypothetical protein D9617_46g064450 [Elsinoe fawcettii]